MHKPNYIRHIANFRKVTIRFVMAFGPSVRQHRITWFPLDEFCKHLIFEILSKNCGGISRVAKI
jgi:hypothetical protein